MKNLIKMQFLALLTIFFIRVVANEPEICFVPPGENPTFSATVIGKNYVFEGNIDDVNLPDCVESNMSLSEDKQTIQIKTLALDNLSDNNLKEHNINVTLNTNESEGYVVTGHEINISTFDYSFNETIDSRIICNFQQYWLNENQLYYPIAYIVNESESLSISALSNIKGPQGQRYVTYVREKNSEYFEKAICNGA